LTTKDEATPRLELFGTTGLLQVPPPIDMRAANCMLQVDAVSSPSCSEPYRNFIEESLPDYETLEKGAQPSAGSAPKEPSTGPLRRLGLAGRGRLRRFLSA
jgi:hypothetical protein